MYDGQVGIRAGDLDVLPKESGRLLARVDVTVRLVVEHAVVVADAAKPRGVRVAEGVHGHRLHQRAARVDARHACGV